MTQKKRKLTDEEKGRLDNSKVPSVTAKGMTKAAAEGDWEEADRRYKLLLDARQKEKDKKKK